MQRPDVSAMSFTGLPHSRQALIEPCWDQYRLKRLLLVNTRFNLCARGIEARCWKAPKSSSNYARSSMALISASRSSTIIKACRSIPNKTCSELKKLFRTHRDALASISYRATPLAITRDCRIGAGAAGVRIITRTAVLPLRTDNTILHRANLRAGFRTRGKVFDGGTALWLRTAGAGS